MPKIAFGGYRDEIAAMMDAGNPLPTGNTGMIPTSEIAGLTMGQRT